MAAPVVFQDPAPFLFDQRASSSRPRTVYPAASLASQGWGRAPNGRLQIECCAFLDASIAADGQARRIDRRVRTSVVHTYIMMGQYSRALDVTTDEPIDPLTLGIVLMMLGRGDEAVKALEPGRMSELPMLRKWTESLQLLAQGRRHEALAATREVMSPNYRDPETFYYVARQLAFLGDGEAAVLLLERAVLGGFSCAFALGHDPWLDVLRRDSRSTRVLQEAELRSRESRAAFLQADGDRLICDLSA